MEREDASGGAGGEEFFEVERAYQGWVMLYFFLALSLWGQWLGLGAWTEIESDDGSAAILALHLLPLAAMALALGWSHSAGRLLIFPISFLPGLVLLTEPDRAALIEPIPLVISTLSFGLYLVVAASRPKSSGIWGAAAEKINAALEDRYAERFQRDLWSRLAGLGLVGAAITYGLFFDPEIARTLEAVSGEDGGDAHHVFIVVLLYFCWMIAVYLGGILPLLNWEYDRRQSPLPPGQRRLLKEPGRLRLRVVVWIGLLFGAISITVWLFGPLT